MIFKISTGIIIYTCKKFDEKEKPRTPGIPKRSPIQVLTGLDVA
jgi:hypothetical protein